MRTHLVGTVLLLSLVLGLRAWAGWDEMVAAYNRGDYATVIRELVPLAQDGDPRAQRNLGLMYLKGQGVPQDYGQALQWYRRAADQGDAGAQYNLGLMYHTGQGVPQDYSQAAQWYLKAVKQGQADAQHNLGVMYEYGQGVPQDYQQAYFWYNLAAGQKSSNPTDHQMGIQSRDRMAARLTPAQLAQAKAQVGIWQSQVPVVQAPRTAAPPEMAQPTQTQQVTPAPVPKHCPYPFIDIAKLLPFLLSPGGPSEKDLRGLSDEGIDRAMKSYHRGEELRRKSVEAVISNALEIQRLRSEFCVGTVD